MSAAELRETIAESLDEVWRLVGAADVALRHELAGLLRAMEGSAP